MGRGGAGRGAMGPKVGPPWDLVEENRYKSVCVYMDKIEINTFFFSLGRISLNY